MIPEHITSEIHEITTIIQTARRSIYEGNPIDITVIEERITTLCQTIEKLPPNETSGLSDILQNFFELLDGLETDINLQHDELTERLQVNEKHVNPLFAQEVQIDDDE